MSLLCIYYRSLCASLFSSLSEVKRASSLTNMHFCEITARSGKATAAVGNLSEDCENKHTQRIHKNACASLWESFLSKARNNTWALIKRSVAHISRWNATARGAERCISRLHCSPLIASFSSYGYPRFVRNFGERPPSPRVVASLQSKVDEFSPRRLRGELFEITAKTLRRGTREYSCKDRTCASSRLS